jgi:hypothetical protein
MTGTFKAELIARKIEARHSPIADDLCGKHDSTVCMHLLVAHVKLCLVATVAAE